MTRRSNWGNISPVFQLDPGLLDPFLSVIKGVWHQQATRGGLIHHYCACIFPKKLAEQNDIQD